MSVNAISSTGGGLGGGLQELSGFVDPRIQIGAGVSDPSLYTLIFSTGIGNSPVPVPAAFYLLGSALSGLALARRRRVKRK